MGFADISQFELLMSKTKKQVNINNSAAAKLLLDYDKAMQSLHFCKKYIKDMQKSEEKGEFVPSTMIAEMYQAKEKNESDLANIEAQLVEQITNEPLDIWDRKIFSRLSPKSREALRTVLDDDVIQRVMEMQAEALKELDELSADSEKEEVPAVKETSEQTQTEESIEEPNEQKQDMDTYGLDVSSTEG